MKQGILFDRFTNLYSLSKTLRFELIPQGKTLDYIEKQGIISEDEARKESYKIVKVLLDEYHKRFISEALSGLELSGVEDLYSLYCSNTAPDQMAKIMDDLREQVAQTFTNHPTYKKLSSREKMINTEILSVLSDDEEKKAVEKAAVESFQKFSTYFVGFFENRENMYSEKAQGTSIANRVINVNLPKFMDNIRAMEIIRRENFFDFTKLAEAMMNVLGEHTIEDLFDLSKYAKFVRNEDIVIYNTILGGLTDGTKKIQGINELINLHNQKKSGRKIPLLKPLYKQILSDRETYSSVNEQYESDQALLDDVASLVQAVDSHLTVNGSLHMLLKEFPDCDLDKIFIANGIPLTELSKAVTGDWASVRNYLEQEYAELFPKKAKNKNDKYIEDVAKYVKKEKSISLGRLNYLAERYSTVNYRFEKRYASEDALFTRYAAARDASEMLLHGENRAVSLVGDQKAISLIKELLDSIKEIEKLIKPLLGAGIEGQKDPYFYGKIQPEYDAIFYVDHIYNRVRNYVTRKPYSTEKFKLNFQSVTLLAGWDKNKEKENYAVLLRKGGLYYLAIMTRGNNKIFESIPKEEGDVFEKMEYKLLPGPNKMLPKVCFAKSNLDRYQPSDKILEIRDKGTFKKGENFKVEDCWSMIDFFKESIQKNPDWAVFDFSFRDTKEYADISQFYGEVQEQGYSVSFKDVPVSYINRMVEEGKLFLFQIYNKDFSPYSKGRPNLHTMYWKALFTPENLQHTVYKLNGEAEVFFRRSSIPEEKKVVHHKNRPIKKRVSEEVGGDETSIFAFDIVKDRRYTVDKFQFHVPITLNFSKASGVKMNDLVLEAIKEVKDVHVIGIDRGERNLLYLSLINSEGKIIEQHSLNMITGENGYSRDYHRILDSREKDMARAREDWKSIASIKELKEGYLSQVIHVILKWMISYNAIIALEDLNFGFKNGRKKVDKQIYQKFEKMLIDKMNYYVDKGVDDADKGGLYHAYQLTAPFESFQKLGKQTGFLFYIPAWNTSMIDPTTGFVNLFNTKYTSIADSRKFILSFEKIKYNQTEGFFEFDFDYSKFTARAHGTVEHWTVCSYGERIINFRNPEKNSEWDSKAVKPTDELMDLLKQYGIDPFAEDLRTVMSEVSEKEFYENFLRIFKQIMQLRNSVTGTEIDYMVSPVRNSSGTFFDTRIGNKEWPLDADANGAYNIARKGLMLVNRILSTGDGEKVKMAIKNGEWLDYAQENPLV